MALGVARWRAILAPWSAEVVIGSALGRKDFNNSHMRRILSYETRKAFWRYREAFELMHTLTIVERVSWSDMVETLQSTRDSWGRTPIPLAGSDSRLAAIGSTLIRHDSELVELYFGFDESVMSPEFRSVLQEIEAAVTPETKRRLDQQELIPVELKLRCQLSRDENPAVEYLRWVGTTLRCIAERASAAAAVATKARGTGQWTYRFPFVLKDVSVDNIAAFSPKEPGIAEALTELMALGVRLDEDLFVGSHSWLSTCPILTLGAVLENVVDETAARELMDITERIVQGDGNHTLYYQELRYSSTGDKGQRILGAFFSAFAVLQQTKTLKVEMSTRDKPNRSIEALIRWLTYALFSKDSASSVTRLEINIPALESWFDSNITRVLEAKNPAFPLLRNGCRDVLRARPDNGGDCDDDRAAPRGQTMEQIMERMCALRERKDAEEKHHDHGFAVAKAGTAITIVPVKASDKATESFVLRNDSRLRVARNVEGDKWVDVVVPCYGHCLVARESIDRFEQSATSESSKAAGYQGAITALKLSDAGWTALFPLILFIGTKLLELNITVGVGSEDLQAILTACPNLVDFALELMYGQAKAVLIEAYASGRCKIENLTISYTSSAESFVYVLEEPTSCAAKTLRRLSIGGRISEDTIYAYARMLKVNRMLEYLRLAPRDREFREPQRALDETNGAALRPRSLQLSSRLAFLSVVWSFSASQTDSDGESPRKRRRRERQGQGRGDSDFDLGRLDQSVISLIFAFGAHPVTREVVLAKSGGSH